MKRTSLRGWCCLCVLLYAQVLVLPAWPETPDHGPDVSCPDGMVAIETEAGWACTCADGYQDDGFGGCVLVDCAADPSAPACGGGGGLSCDEIRDLYCPSDLEVAGVLFADGVALVTCMASFGAGCAAAAGGAGLLHGNLVADVKGCDKKLEEKGCPLQRTAYDQHVATVISGTLARLANEDVPRGGLGTGLSVQQSHRGPATVPEIDVPDPYEALQISSVTRDQLERLYRTGVRRLDQLSEQYYNGELSEAELMQLVQRTHHEMDQEMEKLLGKEGMRQFVEMMAAYSRDLLELYGIRGEPR